MEVAMAYFQVPSWNSPKWTEGKITTICPCRLFEQMHKPNVEQER